MQKMMNSSPHSTLGLLTEKTQRDWKRYRQEAFLNRALGAEWELRQSLIQQASSPYKSSFDKQTLPTLIQIQTSTRRLFGSGSKLSLLKVVPKTEGTELYYTLQSWYSNPLNHSLSTQTHVYARRSFQTLQSRLPHYRDKTTVQLYQSYTPNLMIQRLSVLTDYLQKT